MTLGSHIRIKHWNVAILNEFIPTFWTAIHLEFPYLVDGTINSIIY